jgi:plasmid stabilization system protein ParE
MNPIVADEVLWTNSAKNSFAKIIDWLENNWTPKEVTQLVQRTENMIATLQRYPESCPPSAKHKNVHIGILDKHTKLVYHYNPQKKRITLLLFWGMKQNPAKFRY